jgi:HK97 family phage prohead protease
MHEFVELREVNLTPPSYMRAAARKGIKLHEEGYSGNGLKPQTVEDARDMAAGRVTEAKWRKIGPWIARHMSDLDAIQNNEITAGYVAHLLWGSDGTKAGAKRAMTYANNIVEQLDVKRSWRQDPMMQSGDAMPAMVESQPATEMEPAETETLSLVDELRELLADSVAFYLQAHGAHWNVRGADFAQYHALFQEIYSDVYESIDPIAENIRKLDGEAPYDLTELLSLRDSAGIIPSDSPQSLASGLLMANDYLLTELREVFDCAINYNEQGIANFLAERIDQQQKWGWQLRSSVGGEVRKSNSSWAIRSVDEKRSIAYSNLELRASNDGKTLVGYAAVFDSPSEPLPWTEYVRSGAFRKTINDGADVRLLIDHEGIPLARTRSGTLKLQEDEVGLRVEAQLDETNPDAARVMSALKRGDLSQMSFAFRTVKDSWSENRTVRDLKEVQLFDVSVVTYPAYEQTVAELRRAKHTNPDTVSTASPMTLRKRQIQLRQMQAEQH